MNQRHLMFGLLTVPTIVLIGMGLAFCWATPANSYYHHCEAYYFNHQFCWLIIGACVATGGYFLGWRRWLKATPFVALVWLGLVIYAVTTPCVKGSIGWISCGCCRVNVLEFAPVVFALLAAYLVGLVKAKPLMAVLVGVVTFCGAVGHATICHRIRFEIADLVPSQQIVAKEGEKTAYAFLQNQCVGAVRESRWFGGCDINTRYLPESTTTSMPASSAVIFGKWYLILMAFALASLSLGVGMAFMLNCDRQMRAYSLIWGVAAIIPAFQNVLGCVGLAPISEAGVPFACFGGILIVSTLLGLAILASQASECVPDVKVTRKGWVLVSVLVLELVVMTVFGIFSVGMRDQFEFMGSSARVESGSSGPSQK